MKIFWRISKLIPIILILFFSWSNLARASFEITEIMYDLDGTDTDREWVEVQNTGTSTDDLSKWFFFSDNTKHALVPQGESNVVAGGYAVIAQNAMKFKIDWPNYSGLLFDSSWTGLNNDGETIALKDPDLNVVSSVSFTSSMGGAGDGNSLQKVGGTWGSATPTPGTQNQVGGGGGGGSSSSSGSGGGIPSTTELKPVLKKEIEIPKITTNILAKNINFVGLPLNIDSKTIGLKKEPIIIGRFAWNFGDGTGFSMNDQKQFEHTYDYPGEYVLSLSYYSNAFEKEPEATDRIIVKVLPSEIFISSVGDITDLYVELTNKSSYELNLSNWVLKSYLNSFTIPNGTIILPNNKIKISSKVTGFKSEDIKYLSLQNTIGEIMATYPSSRKTNYSKPSSIDSLKNNTNNSKIIDLNNLGASAQNSNIYFSNQSMSIIGLIFILLIGIVIVVLIRKKNNLSDELDENIKSSDITILE